MLQLTEDKAMSQSQCEFMKMAEEYIAKLFPFFDSTRMTLVVSENEQLWEMTYRLPSDMLGGAPIVTIHKRTCLVVRVQLTQ